MKLIFLFLLVAFWIPRPIVSLAPCTGEQPDICGFLPSTYVDLGLGGVPALCNADCTLPGGFDRCGVCGGIASYDPSVIFQPSGLTSFARMGGSVATWNGSVALSQHLKQELPVLTNVPVMTWTLNHTSEIWNPYTLPTYVGDMNDFTDTTPMLPIGRGFGLEMNADYLVVGSHDSKPYRYVQLWTKTNSPEWSWTWTANDPCPGNYFGFSVAVDNSVPKDANDGVFDLIAAGDPAAFKSGRVMIYFSYSPAYHQILYFGNGNETEVACFGYSVSADNGWLAVGAPQKLYSATTHAGTVYIFQWNPALGLQGQYEFAYEVNPPSPETNGGFGKSVAVSNNMLIVGDNKFDVYHYQLGVVAVQQSLTMPTGLNLISRLGYTVSVWDNYVLAGDENFFVDATARGATFVWDDNPLDPGTYRPMYQLNDDLSSYNTRYGADVDVRGGCFAVSGSPGTSPSGAIHLVNLCRDDCYDCNGVLNGCIDIDICEVCAGDNSTCVDCFGVFEGPAEPDSCGVCEGTNTTCVLPYTTIGDFTNVTCNVAEFAQLHHEFETQHGPATWSLIPPFPANGDVIILGNNTLNANITYLPDPYFSGTDNIYLWVEIVSTGATEIFNISVFVDTCYDCFGVLNGTARYDLCGVCNGLNNTCNGCDGIPNSGLVYDYCGVCGGDNTTCIEILIPPTQNVSCTSQIYFQLLHEPSNIPVTWEIIQGPFFGTVALNEESGFILYHNPVYWGPDWFEIKATSQLNSSVYDIQNVTFLIEECIDCAGNQLGTQIEDVCGICGGDGTSCLDCLGVPNGPNAIGLCLKCNDNTSCLDCNNVPFGPAVIDICGVCGGDNSTCTVGGSVVAFLYVVAWIVFIIIVIGTIYTVLEWIFRKLYPNPVDLEEDRLVNEEEKTERRNTLSRTPFTKSVNDNLRSLGPQIQERPRRPEPTGSQNPLAYMEFRSSEGLPRRKR